jgi:hydroxyethylthiazole kinase-like uncharacterized protein yjeF
MRNGPSALLDVAQMNEADRLSALLGVAGTVLMENAGAAVFDALQRRWPQGLVVVLCGPGNNGGDGFVVARLLAQAGRQVRVALLGAREHLKGDARHHANLWQGDVLPLDPVVLQGADVVVDALLGSGLRRPLSGVVPATLAAVHARGIPIVAVDVPSGVSGDTGASWGAVPCTITVTFFRKKPGHLLLPARALCGAVEVADIGTPAAVLDMIVTTAFENTPALWSEALGAGALEWAWQCGPRDATGDLDATGNADATADADPTADMGETGDALAFARAASRVSGMIVVIREGDSSAHAGAVRVGAVSRKGAKGRVLEWNDSIEGVQAALIVAAPDGRAAILAPAEGLSDMAASPGSRRSCWVLLPDCADTFLAVCAAVYSRYRAA